MGTVTSAEMEVFGYEEDKILLKDRALNRIVEVTLRGGRLYCYLDRTDDCIHVDFCSTIPLVRTFIRGA